MQIGILSYNESGKGYYRLTQPYAWIGLHNPDIKVKFFKNLFNFIPKETFAGYDYIVMQGIFSQNPEFVPNLIKIIRQLGIKVIYDLDDIDFAVSKENPVYNEFQKTIPHIIECLRCATIITTPSMKLAGEIREYNNHVYVYLNAIDYDYWYWNYPKIEDEWVRIAYIGGSSHIYDLLTIAGLGKWIIDAFPNTKFILGGYDSRMNSAFKDGIKWITYYEGKENVWEQYKEILFRGKYDPVAKKITFEGTYDKNRVEILRTQPIDLYPKLFTNADIVIAPLKDTRFNNNKSNLKILESSARAIPIVCSDLKMYREVIMPNMNGMMARSIPEWKSCLKRLIENKELRESMGKRLKEDMMKEHDIKVVCEKRIALLKKLLEVK